MSTRIADELALLRRHYGSVKYSENAGQHWFEVTGFRAPAPWSPELVSVAFSVTQGYPEVAPYGFYVPRNLTFRGTTPFAVDGNNPTPFSGEWAFLSWQPVGWCPTEGVATGSNLWAWVRSFRARLEEGP